MEPSTEAVTAEQRVLVDGWREANVLWAVPDEMADDLYFMYAMTLLGPHARVLTNDELRDHRARMGLDADRFARWKARHVVNFDFARARGSEGPLAQQLLLEEVLCYTREIQTNGDGAWHLPAKLPPTSPSQGPKMRSEWEWLCVRVNEPGLGTKPVLQHPPAG